MTNPMPLSPTDVTDSIVSQIKNLIARSKSLDPDSLHLNTSFDDLEIDSLDKINLTFEIEELYQVEIPDDSLNSLRTVGDVVTGVERLLAAKPPAEA